jgi:hypothetical protein
LQLVVGLNELTNPPRDQSRGTEPKTIWPNQQIQARNPTSPPTSVDRLDVCYACLECEGVVHINLDPVRLRVLVL